MSFGYKADIAIKTEPVDGETSNEGFLKIDYKMSSDLKTGITFKTKSVDEKKSSEDSKTGISIKTEPVDGGTSNEDSKTGISIKTEPIAEESSNDDPYDIRKRIRFCGYYVATPAWFCQMFNIEAKNTLTEMKFVDTDHGEEVNYFITVRKAVFDKKMFEGIPMTKKEEWDKMKNKDHVMKAFMAGKDVRRMLIRPPRVKKEVPVTQRRTMTRKTKEREAMKRRMEERLVKKVEKPCFVFKCTYCGHEYNRLAQLKNHVFGVKAKRSTGRNKLFLNITCYERLKKDGLRALYKSKEMRCNLPDPKKKIWAKIVCKDTNLIDSNGKFIIPDKIAKEYAKYFEEIQL